MCLFFKKPLQALDEVDAAHVRACVHACACMHSNLSTLGVEPAHLWFFSHLFAQGDSSQWRLRIACEHAELQPCKAWELGCVCMCVFMQACIRTCMFTTLKYMQSTFIQSHKTTHEHKRTHIHTLKTYLYTHYAQKYFPHANMHAC